MFTPGLHKKRSVLRLKFSQIMLVQQICINKFLSFPQRIRTPAFLTSRHHRMQCVQCQYILYIHFVLPSAGFELLQI